MNRRPTKLVGVGWVLFPVAWRALLTALYAVALGALLAVDNYGVDVPVPVTLGVWMMAPAVGFLVGRWWVLLAVVGAVAGRAIGWDAGEHDGNPALWPPYVLTAIAFVGAPLLLGLALSLLWRGPASRNRGAD
jgi:hypothetical protein